MTPRSLNFASLYTTGDCVRAIFRTLQSSTKTNRSLSQETYLGCPSLSWLPSTATRDLAIEALYAAVMTPMAAKKDLLLPKSFHLQRFHGISFHGNDWHSTAMSPDAKVWFRYLQTGWFPTKSSGSRKEGQTSTYHSHETIGWASVQHRQLPRIKPQMGAVREESENHSGERRSRWCSLNSSLSASRSVAKWYSRSSAILLLCMFNLRARVIS